MKKILITGACGFVGLHLARYLHARGGVELTLVDNFSRGVRDAEVAELSNASGVRVVEADLTQPQAFDVLEKGYDEVYHLAAVIGVRNVMERPWDVVRVNALSTLNVLDWMLAGGGKKMLFSSTSEAYAWTRLFHDLPVPTPENVPLALTDISNPRSSYAGSKIFGELAVTHACRKAGLPFVIVRYHNVYGPRMGFQHVIPELFQRVTGGENPLRVFSADHTRAFCYVDDAVRATVLCMENSITDGATLNIGNDREEISIRQLAQEMLRVAGMNVPLHEVEAAHDPIKRRCPDLTELRRLTGYEPEVSLAEGLKRTLDWYRPHLKS